MTRTVLLGAAMGTLLLAAGAAAAQPYQEAQPYQGDQPYQVYPAYPGPREPIYDNGRETVIVHPDQDYIEKHQALGRFNGEINPTAYSISRAVDLSDLDLSQPADRREMRNRIYQTAVNVCYALDDSVPGLSGDERGDSECVRQATRNALADVRYQRYG